VTVPCPACGWSAAVAGELCPRCGWQVDDVAGAEGRHCATSECPACGRPAAGDLCPHCDWPLVPSHDADELDDDGDELGDASDSVTLFVFRP